jgi:spermidine synthase
LPILLLLLIYLVTVVGVLALIVALFTVLGGFVGRGLSQLVPLRGYGVNLAGSLAGVATFTALSFFNVPPVGWLIIGFVFLVPFFFRDKLGLIIFVGILIATGLPSKNTLWSPYYRIDFSPFPASSPQDPGTSYLLSVNHDYHQKVVDLSPAFMAKYPSVEPNHSAFPTYELPYRLVPDPENVLIVGAGTGNDVAAALRHGAKHVDAVEIDPVIQRLGREFHPEHPYSSPRVTVHINDARAFLKQTHDKYDLIVFGYLDAHTLISSYSSLRLDNYVYTVQSFQEARQLLKDGGSLVLAFGSGKTFVTDRMYATLANAFGVVPVAYFTGYDASGVVFVEGSAQHKELSDFARYIPDERWLKSAVVATDTWPFLYLAGRYIPPSILVGLLAFLIGARVLLRKTGSLPWRSHREHFHFLLLGAGFLLLETKAVTDLALLFGSTWIVNAIVIAAFLTMALAANALAILRPISLKLCFAFLFLVLGIGLVVPYSVLNGTPLLIKIMGAGLMAGIPVFFSGLIFSNLFREVRNPAEALGMNLFGAVLGGILENAAMIGGTPILGVIAIMLYGSAAVFALARGRQKQLGPAATMSAAT